MEALIKLLWNNDICVNLLIYSSGHIDVSIVLSNSITLSFTSLYVNPKLHLGISLWIYYVVYSLFWLVAGDFNEILSFD